MARRPLTDQPEDQKVKFAAHKGAHDTVSHYMEHKQYLSAFVVAFSLLEDRITAFDVVHRRDVLKELPHLSKEIRGLSKSVNALHKAGYFSDKFSSEIFALNNLRNHLFHAAMYNLDAVAAEHVKEAVRLKKLVANRLGKLKRTLGKSTS